MTEAPTFVDLLAEHGAHRTEATALSDATDALTYGDLNRLVTHLAERFVAAGVAPDDRVVLIADNSVHQAVVAFAVWRAGATLVTIYPSSTAAEVAYAVGNADPVLIVSGRHVASIVRPVADDLGVPLVELTGSGALIGLTDATARPPAGVAVGAVALICYTSGSTSRPKAVVHSHGGLLAAAIAYAEVWNLGPTDATLVALPLAWAFGLVTTTMATLSSGGHVRLLARTHAGEMVDSIVKDGITFVAGVTTMYVKMVAALETAAAVARPDALRLCISGGEPRNDVAFARWEALTGCPVHDVYAASECFPLVTYDPVQDLHPRPGCAGRVVPGAELRVVDPEGRDVALGAPGEAWGRGPALMLGYWRDPELTAAALTGDGWYRTGDLVRIDADGYVEVVGRLSDLIIRGGANVAPAEVEAVLLDHPDVREAAVVGLPDPEYGEQIVAAVVLRASASDDLGRLRTHCAASLASYKVPNRFVAVPSLPHNPNTDKVQRREVAELVRGLLATSTGIRP